MCKNNTLAYETKSFIWGYGHYFVFVFVFATAVCALISVNVDVLSHHATIQPDTAVLGLALAISGYLVSIWVCHDLLLNKKGIQKYELLILAALVMVIAIFIKSIFLIGLIFVLLNIIRLVRRHKQFHSEAL